MPELTRAELSALLDALGEHPDADDPWCLYPHAVADAMWTGKRKLRAMLVLAERRASRQAVAA